MNNLFDIDGNIWIKKDNRGFIGRGRVELLQNIQIYGSISKAAKHMKMSYKAAWDSVDIMNKLSQKPLVTKVTGGKGGGGTVITSHAKELIQAYEEISKLYKNYFQTLENSFNEQISDTSSQEPAFSRLCGTICMMKNIDENYEISIRLKSGQILTSIENKKFVIEKDFKVEDEINFLIETDNIILTKNNQINNSARNRIFGKVTSIHDDKINSNITINCGENDIIYSKITSSSCEKLELKVDDEVYASFKAYNVIIL
ncbi:TOBE domain-containing protein [Arcobacter sp. LA11]|uniref:TOBE domain-containing protein n=1 Tax=Arcobacter sp. LA11 TaxID=1898176 RepID=UPI00093342AF|nr:TOBE domain-containing protein [Arcobacter sp. LA11]